MKKESSEQQQRALRKLVRSHKPTLPANMNVVDNQDNQQLECKQNLNQNDTNEEHHKEKVDSSIKYDCRQNEDSTESTDSQLDILKQNSNTSYANSVGNQWIPEQEVSEKNAKKPRKKRISRTLYRHDNIDYIKPSKQKLLQNSFSCAFKKLVDKSKEIYSKIDEPRNHFEKLPDEENSESNNPTDEPKNTGLDMPSLSPEPEKIDKIGEDINTKFNKNKFNERTRLTNINSIETNKKRQLEQRELNMQHNIQKQIDPGNTTELHMSTSQNLSFPYYKPVLNQQSTIVQDILEAQMQQANLKNLEANKNLERFSDYPKNFTETHKRTSRHKLPQNYKQIFESEKRQVPTGLLPTSTQSVTELNNRLKHRLPPEYSQNIGEIKRRTIHDKMHFNNAQKIPEIDKKMLHSGIHTNFPQNMYLQQFQMTGNYPQSGQIHLLYPSHVHQQILQNSTQQPIPQQNISSHNIPQHTGLQLINPQQTISHHSVHSQNVSSQNKEKQQMPETQTYSQQVQQGTQQSAANVNKLFPVFPGIPSNYLLQENSKINQQIDKQQQQVDVQTVYINPNSQHEQSKSRHNNIKNHPKLGKVQNVSHNQANSTIENRKIININLPENSNNTTVEENLNKETTSKLQQNINTIPYQIIIQEPNSQQITVHNAQQQQQQQEKLINKSKSYVSKNNRQQIPVVQNISHRYQNIQQNKKIGYDKQDVINRTVMHKSTEQNVDNTRQKRSASQDRSDDINKKRAYCEMLTEKINLLRSINREIDRVSSNCTKNLSNSPIIEKRQDQLHNTETIVPKINEREIVSPNQIKKSVVNNNNNNIQILEDRIIRVEKNTQSNDVFNKNLQQNQNQSNIIHSIESILSRECSLKRQKFIETQNEKYSLENEVKINSFIPLSNKINHSIDQRNNNNNLKDFTDKQKQLPVERISSKQLVIETVENTQIAEKQNPVLEMSALKQISEKYVRRKNMQNKGETEKYCDVNNEINDKCSKKNYASDTVPCLELAHSNNRREESVSNLIPLNLSLKNPENINKENNDDLQSNTGNNSIWSISDLNTTLDDVDNLSYVKNEEEYNKYLKMLEDKKATKPLMFYKFVTGVQKLNNQPMINLRTFFCLLKKGKLADYKKLFIQVNNNNNTC